MPCVRTYVRTVAHKSGAQLVARRRAPYRPSPPYVIYTLLQYTHALIPRIPKTYTPISNSNAAPTGACLRADHDRCRGVRRAIGPGNSSGSPHGAVARKNKKTDHNGNQVESTHKTLA